MTADRRDQASIEVSLDDERADKLARLAEESGMASSALAQVLLSCAIDEAEVVGGAMATVLAGIPGAAERVRLAKQQVARGEAIALDDL